MGKTTDAFARGRMVKAQSVLARLCRTGSYFGIRPRKHVNGRLEWPDDDESQPGPSVAKPNDDDHRAAS